MTQKVLTANLRDMEGKGLLTRKVYAEVPPRVEYTLIELGYCWHFPSHTKCSLYSFQCFISLFAI